MLNSTKIVKVSFFATVVLLVIATSSAKFCGKLGSFDALCMKDDVVFILTFSPCHGKNYANVIQRRVYLTIIDTKNKFKKYDITANKSIIKPLSFGRTDVGILLELHYHPSGAKKGHLHVDLALGNFSDDGINTKKTLLDVYFYDENAGFCFDGFSGASFYPAPACQESKRTGNLSTLCITKPSTSIDKKSQGIFFISVDPCSAPVSYWVVALMPNKGNLQVIERFTASKTDLFVPVDNATCGFKVKYTQNHAVSFSVMLKLMYGCDDATSVQLVNDYYFLDSGVMCPHAKCKALASRRRLCSSNMIVGRNKSVGLTFDIQISGCDEKYSVKSTVTMEGEANKLYLILEDPEHTLDFIFDGVNRTKETKQVMKPVTSGYIPKTGGYISAVTMFWHVAYDDYGDGGEGRRHGNTNYAYLVIDRFYGAVESDSRLIAPLAFEEFSLPECRRSKQTLKGHASLSAGVKAVIALSAIVVVAAVIGFVVYRRRQRGKSQDGLPYQIELNYADEGEGDFQDEL